MLKIDCATILQNDVVAKAAAKKNLAVSLLDLKRANNIAITLSRYGRPIYASHLSVLRHANESQKLRSVVVTS